MEPSQTSELFMRATIADIYGFLRLHTWIAAGHRLDY